MDVGRRIEFHFWAPATKNNYLRAIMEHGKQQSGGMISTIDLENLKLPDQHTRNKRFPLANETSKWISRAMSLQFDSRRHEQDDCEAGNDFLLNGA